MDEGLRQDLILGREFYLKGDHAKAKEHLERVVDQAGSLQGVARALPPEVTASKLKPPPVAAAAAATVLAAAKAEAEALASLPAPARATSEEWRRPWLFPYELLGAVALVLAGSVKR